MAQQSTTIYTILLGPKFGQPVEIGDFWFLPLFAFGFGTMLGPSLTGVFRNR